MKPFAILLVASFILGPIPARAQNPRTQDRETRILNALRAHQETARERARKIDRLLLNHAVATLEHRVRRNWGVPGSPPGAPAIDPELERLASLDAASVMEIFERTPVRRGRNLLARMRILARDYALTLERLQAVDSEILAAHLDGSPPTAQETERLQTAHDHVFRALVRAVAQAHSTAAAGDLRAGMRRPAWIATAGVVPALAVTLLVRQLLETLGQEPAHELSVGPVFFAAMIAVMVFASRFRVEPEARLESDAQAALEVFRETLRTEFGLTVATESWDDFQGFLAGTVRQLGLSCAAPLYSPASISQMLIDGQFDGYRALQSAK